MKRRSNLSAVADGNLNEKGHYPLTGRLGEMLDETWSCLASNLNEREQGVLAEKSGEMVDEI